MVQIPSQLIQLLRTARRVAVLTGAGVSKESGVPTFRDPLTGLWEKYRAEDLCTPEAFARDPRLVWEWHAWLREKMARADPNPGHVALADLEKWLVARDAQFTLITQNIDGLHQRAGSLEVIELHGNIHKFVCSMDGGEVTKWAPGDDVPPRCRRCGALVRPDVVWYGESLPPAAIGEAWAAAEKCDVWFSIGTSAVVQPAAALPWVALRRGAVVVEINPEETPLSAQAQYFLRGPAGQVLPELVKTLKA